MYCKQTYWVQLLGFSLCHNIRKTNTERKREAHVLYWAWFLFLQTVFKNDSFYFVDFLSSHPGSSAACFWQHEDRIFTVNCVESFIVHTYCMFCHFVLLPCLLCFLVAVMFTANRHPQSLLLTHPHTYTVCGRGRSLAMVAGIWQAFPHMT